MPRDDLILTVNGIDYLPIYVCGLVIWSARTPQPCNAQNLIGVGIALHRWRAHIFIFSKGSDFIPDHRRLGRRWSAWYRSGGRLASPPRGCSHASTRHPTAMAGSKHRYRQKQRYGRVAQQLRRSNSALDTLVRALTSQAAHTFHVSVRFMILLVLGRTTASPLSACASSCSASTNVTFLKFGCWIARDRTTGLACLRSILDCLGLYSNHLLEFEQ